MHSLPRLVPVAVRGTLLSLSIFPLREVRNISKQNGGKRFHSSSRVNKAVGTKKLYLVKSVIISEKLLW